jgi:hypothetical protein
MNVDITIGWNMHMKRVLFQAIKMNPMIPSKQKYHIATYSG